MSEDWEDLALNHRRLPHGRTKKGGNASGRNGAGSFNPNSSFGVYELYGTAISRLTLESEKAIFEIHEFTDTDGGLSASLVLGEKLEAAVLLAGSRKLLANLVAEADADEDGDAEDDDADAEDGSDAASESEEEAGDDEDDEVDLPNSLDAKDRARNARTQAFEKNSFRSPKFWLQWQGDTVKSDDEKVRERNVGYIVFSGGDCKSFQGTLSSRSLGWKDAAISGRKVTSKARPPPVKWQDYNRDEDEDKDEEEGAEEKQEEDKRASESGR